MVALGMLSHYLRIQVHFPAAQGHNCKPSPPPNCIESLKRWRPHQVEPAPRRCATEARHSVNRHCCIVDAWRCRRDGSRAPRRIRTDNPKPDAVGCQLPVTSRPWLGPTRENARIPKTGALHPNPRPRFHSAIRDVLNWNQRDGVGRRGLLRSTSAGGGRNHRGHPDGWSRVGRDAICLCDHRRRGNWFLGRGGLFDIRITPTGNGHHAAEREWQRSPRAAHRTTSISPETTPARTCCLGSRSFCRAPSALRTRSS